ncbi:hypothetical protein [Humisphaera borealis]|uniref:Uncharacterized protein n=1 Tax=Humisphaera borealis TaxID=2807512 RepID=A0A7M2WZ72_9BACT|nr:hypothetical protein [Humisphaera borealis]QOV90664.1 hypothetical protein IPV69_04700 [Humisphaera borealis]
MGLIALAGCQSSPPPPSQPRLGPVGQMERRSYPDPVKPLPGPDSAESPAPPFADVPLVYQRPPEQKMFVDGYNAVGRPKLAVFVNRSLLGDALPIEAAPVAERVPPSGVDPIRGNPFRDEHGQDITYLRSGQYDEASAKQIDYATIENVMTQWLACEGQTTIASPAVVRERLNADEIGKLQQGRTRQLGELAKELNADILIYAQARPTRQTERGLEIRLNVEAINISHGEQIARATVLIPPPLDTERINMYTRFIARKLMADMAMTWSGPGPARQQTDIRPALPTVPEPTPISPGRQPVAPPVAPAEQPVQPKVIDPPPIKPAVPSDPKPAPSGVPAEKPSVLDRPEPPSATRQPDADFPPPPASARRNPE